MGSGSSPNSPSGPLRPSGPVRPSTAVRRRSELEIRWRQFRKAPRPIVRAVLSSLIVAVVLGVLYLGYDLAIEGGATLPGGDLRTLFVAVDIVIVLLVGSVVTWLVVPQPGGSSGQRVRTPWSAALGFFAAVPIAYLTLVVLGQIVKPILLGR